MAEPTYTAEVTVDEVAFAWDEFRDAVDQFLADNALPDSTPIAFIDHSYEKTITLEIHGDQLAVYS